MNTPSHASPVKDGRRVLGEKPANACLSPAARRRSVDAAAAISPLKRPSTEYTPSSSPTKKKQLLPSPPFTGQKRGIDQVEQQEQQQDQENVGGGSWRMLEAFKSGERKRPNATGPYASALRRFREPLQEQDLFVDPSLSTDVSNSHPNQGHDPPQTVPDDPEARKVFIQEKATLLRTRIQSAMRHVKDDQLDRRLSELEAHGRRYSRSHKSQQHQPPSPSRISIAAAAVANKTTAAASLPPDQSTPRTLQPAPELKPARETTDAVSGLSSPPLSTDNATHDPMETPTQASISHLRQNLQPQGSLQSPMQLGSPPATVPRSVGSGDETELPSQKGDAVDGLLKLMST